MALRNRLDFTVIPKVPENYTPEQRRAIGLATLARFLDRDESSLSLGDKEAIRSRAAECLDRYYGVSARFQTVAVGKNAVADIESLKLLRYVSEAIAILRTEIPRADRQNLASLFGKVLHDASSFYSDDSPSRTLQETAREFLLLEPALTVCLMKCGIASPGNNIGEILAGALPEHAGEVVDIRTRAGKPFKSPADIRRGMAEAGSAGVSQDVRNLQGYEVSVVNFQKAVETWDNLVESAKEPATQPQRDEHKKGMADFRRLETVLRPRAIEVIQLMGKENTSWDPGSYALDMHKKCCVFRYYMGMIERFYPGVQKKDVMGVYALLGVCREAVAKILTSDFFDKSVAEHNRLYMESVEPMFTALGSRCGIELAPFASAVAKEEAPTLEYYKALNKTLSGYGKANK